MLLSRFAILTFLIQNTGAAKELIEEAQAIYELTKDGVNKADLKEIIGHLKNVLTILEPIIDTFPTNIFGADEDSDELADSLSAAVGKPRPMLEKLIKFFIENWAIILPLFLDETPE
jgi:hypothetical protein